jgi:hypothetical protein
LALKDLKSVFAPQGKIKFGSSYTPISDAISSKGKIKFGSSYTPISDAISSNFGDDIGIFEYGHQPIIGPKKGDIGPGPGGQGIRSGPSGKIIKIYKQKNK